MTKIPAPAGTRPSRPARKRLGWRSRVLRDNAAAWMMIAPAAVLLVWWYAVPIVQSVVLSFQKVNKFHFDQRTFIGLENYQQLVHDPAFWESVRITATFVAFVVPAQTVLALVIAALLHGVTRGRTALRTAFFVPYMTSTVAVTTVFMQLFVKGGAISSFFALFGLPDITWYANVRFALPFLIIVYVYMFVGLYIVIFVGGMESIPATLYEAAEIDGAGALSRFWHVTLPGLRPFTAFVLIAGVIQAVQVFDQAYVISGGTILGSPAGATSTLVIFIYQQAFRLNAVGYGSAATVALLVLVIVAGLISRRFGAKAEAA